MDARNDDSSGGSDSLDKSLQLKCVVDDFGQGEGKQAENSVSGPATSILLQNTENNSEINHRTQQNKTEKTIGDVGRDNGGAVGGNGSSVAATASATATVDALNKLACDDISTNTKTTITKNVEGTAISGSISNHIDSNCSSSSNSSNNNNNNAFESKVKQISKDLKETTLAEYNTTSEASTNNVRSSSASTSSTSSSSSETGASIAGAASDQLEQCDQLNVSDSADDTRSKKVRFHPDVKENDGGNRVIPKKKKKLKGSTSEETGSATDNSQSTPGTDDEMDYEEEDAAEEEEEFNLAKTIAEAQNYLKLHPLTFVRSNNSNKSASNIAEDTSKRLHNGLLQEEDLPLLSESSEDEDFYEEITPECGVERILGKQVRNGKTLLLVRYVNDDGLYWECEERIATMCPTMMSKYEINRERRQERLMRHVAKRQNLRQRYTDF